MAGDGNTTYDYRDVDDQLRYQVVRKQRPDGTKTFFQRHRNADDAWVNNLEDIERIPFRLMWLDDHRNNRPTEPVFVVEGEKDVETLMNLGCTATTSAQGANWDWPDHWADHFAGLSTVIVLADNDEPGRKCARQRARIISKTVKDVRVIWSLPDVSEKGDVTDWIEAGHDADELLALVHEAPFFDPTELGVDEDPVEPAPTLDVIWVRDAIANPPEEPPVLIEGLLRVGELCVFGAPRAIGKSWLVMNLATLLSRGEGLFLGKLKVNTVAPTLISQGELGLWDSFNRWRMLNGVDGPPEHVAETFDRWRLRIAKKRRSGQGVDGQWMEEWYAALIDPRLEHTIATHGFKVLIIDPWAVYYAGQSNDNDQAEKALDLLRDLALRYGLAVVIMHHISGKTDAFNKEPEDLWRGATRLADWASTRVTILPHYKSEKKWKEAGLTRKEARRRVDVHFLRRGPATEDFSAIWSPATGWWDQWAVDTADEEAADPRWAFSPEQIAEECRNAGGWASMNAAAKWLKCSHHTAKNALERAERAGVVTSYPHGKGVGWRLPEERLDLPAGNTFSNGIPVDSYEGEGHDFDEYEE